MASQQKFDAVVIGAGFSGIYQLYTLKKLGLSVKVIDFASDVGGTWYWNKYPGAMSDTEAYIYRYSWDKDDLLSYPWKEHYVKQPEVLTYLNHVVDKHDLRKYIQFDAEMQSARWDDSSRRWRLDLSTGETITTRFLVTALGLLSKQNYPDIPGIDTFKGAKVHTGKYPADLDIMGKRVAVIGNGSTGVQVITSIASKVKSLVSFQRHPQYSVPSGDGPVLDDYRQWVNDNYDSIWHQVLHSITAFGFKESKTSCMSISPEERERVFQENWDKGNGFRFMFGTFNDITTDEAANEAACDFIRRKIAQIVKDPEKRRKLQPHDYYARRPLCDNGYYEQFDRKNVDIVSLQENPIHRITESGIKMSDGTEYSFDVIIFATGFDAVEGNYTRIGIHGRNDLSLAEAWSGGPHAYLGLAVPQFPNLFQILGPQGPFTNQPPAIEVQVEFVTDAIARTVNAGPDACMEAEAQAEKGWLDLCEKLASRSLFRVTNSWIFGVNIPGKTYALRFYFGGMQNYMEALRDVKKNDFRGFTGFRGASEEKAVSARI